MRENNLLDFNMYEQSLTQNVKQPNGAYSEQATPPPNLITKDITENGEYSAADDNADGYSSVTVDVSGGVGFNRLKSIVLTGNYPSNISIAEVINSEDGEYEYTSSRHTQQDDILTAFTPLKSFKYIMTEDYSYLYLAFTPDDSFKLDNAFSIQSTEAPPSSPTITGDIITPGDGKVYFASLDMDYGEPNKYTINITKKDDSVWNWINVLS